jgi:hypothetical protein
VHVEENGCVGSLKEVRQRLGRPPPVTCLISSDHCHRDVDFPLSRSAFQVHFQSEFPTLFTPLPIDKWPIYEQIRSASGR